MLITRIFSSAVILALLLSVNAATMSAEEADFTNDSTTTESNVDTYPQTIDVFLKDGKVFSSNDEINVNTDVPIETNGKKQYWKLDEYTSVDFSFALPSGAKNVRVELNCISTENLKGKAIVRWNGKYLKNDKGERETIDFNGKNFRYPLELKSSSTENKLKILCQEGVIGIQSASVYFDSPLPSWNNDGVSITLLKPLPDMVYGGSQVELVWKSTGFAVGGWLKVEYRPAGQQDWKIVPGLEGGVMYGQNIWHDNQGLFVWKNPPKTPKCEYRFTYTRGKSPIEVAIEQERLRQTKSLDLAQRKWEFLKEAKGIIDKKYWKEIPGLDKKYKESNDLSLKLEKQFRELETNKPSAERVDLNPEQEMNKLNAERDKLNLVISNLSKLEAIYFTAINAILSSASVRDIEKCKTYADIADSFLESCDNVYKSAKLDYEDDAVAMELLQEFFPKEKFQAVKEMQEEVNDLISKGKKRFAAALELATMKWEFLQKSEDYIDTEYWKEKLNDKYYTAQGLIEKIPPQLGNLSNSNDTNPRYNELNPAISNMSKLEALYIEAIQLMLSSISEQDNIKKSEKYLEDVNKLDNLYEETCKNALNKYEKDEDNKDLLPELFPTDKYSFFKKMKSHLEAEILYQKAEKSAAADEFGEQDWSAAVKLYRQAAESGHIQAMVSLGNYYNDITKDFNEAVEWYRKAAEQGNAQAQYELGECYYNNKGVSQDYEEAVKWYRQAAEQGYIQGHYMLGLCYYFGNGVTEDITEGVKLIRKAAVQGYAPAQDELAGCYFNGVGVPEDNTKGIEWLRKAAEQGFVPAQSMLGKRYFNGVGVAEDKTEGVKWLREAAEQGDYDAQCELGDCYFNGNGVAQDYAEAVKWLGKVAEQGNIVAQYKLGCCYLNGKGIAQDYEDAIEWLRKAAEQEYVDAQYELGCCYLDGKGGTVDRAEGIKLIRKAAEKGYDSAQLKLGLCYLNGKGVAEDRAEGIKLIRKMAEQGNAEAQYELGCCYLDGKGGTVDRAEGVKLIRKMAEQGYAPAQCKLGYYYVEAEDASEALRWLRKAAEQEYAEAYYWLGACYIEGFGVTKDVAEGIRWARKAAEHGSVEAQYQLGSSYLDGNNDFPVNQTEGLKWMLKAAAQGNLQAQFDLGWRYLNGKGVPKDEAEGKKWIRKAQDNGYEP